MSVSNRDSALALVHMGYRVFQVHSAKLLPSGPLTCTCGRPSCASPAKHPVARFSPNGVLSASNVLHVVDAWWRANPDANVGLATDDLIVVDVDTRKGGSDTLATLECEHGALPATWRSLTGGGGEHVFFQAPDGLRFKNSVERVGPGIDIRATGGYVIAPPSLHISGRRYAWNVDYHPDLTPLADPPTWLCKLAGDAPPSPTSGARTSPSSGRIWRRAASARVRATTQLRECAAISCGTLSTPTLRSN